MEIFNPFVITIFLLFLSGALFLIPFSASIFTLSKLKEILVLKKEILKIAPNLKFFLKDSLENFYFIVNLTKRIANLIYAFIGFLFLINLNIPIIFSILIVLLALFVLDITLRSLGAIFPKEVLFLSHFISSIYLILLFPITFPTLKITKYIFKKTKKSLFQEKNLIDLIYDIDIKKVIDHKIFKSLLTFKEKVAREVMIPRIKVLSLPSSATVREASKKILSEGYSRIPVYKDKIDNVIGILMYKDILKIYTQSDKSLDINNLLDSPIETLIKPAIYVPENKKISHLFQEFRLKQRHLAIVVNEYGGTEGIITIEDILEELVGEIQDEYDIELEKEFWKLPNGSYVVDAKMSIIDIEKKLNIKIPHHPEYETIGGFVFHLAGTIPEKGWSLHLDEFDMEVLISNERCIEKIRITPLKIKT